MIFSSAKRGRGGFGDRWIFSELGQAKRKKARIGFLVLVAIASLWLFACSRVYVNASWSDPAWGYFLLPLYRDPGPGDRVLFDPPLAGSGTPWPPYMKTVFGTPGMGILASDEGVWVGGEYAGRAKKTALDGRQLKSIGAGAIPPGRYYLHADHPDSHDSRYAEIGLVRRDRILGFALPLPDLPFLGLNGPLAGPGDIEGIVKKMEGRR